MKKIGKWLLWFVGGLLGVLIIGLFILGLFPVPKEQAVPPEQFGVGSSSVQPSVTGLQREFPPLNGETTPEQAELGRLLFFDPVLSADNDLSCAHCHQPDYGFADGQRIAVGAGGQGAGPERTDGLFLTRGTPSLWNAGFSQLLFWDGRAHSLEDQALVPLTRPDEMAADPDEIVAELQAIPEYSALFAQAFGDPAITIERVTHSLAAFERTLISNDSPFDRYAAGDLEALSPSQRRGLNLFRSAATRCFECHQAPTFSSDTLRVVGVPGMLGDTGAGKNDFKVPSLRNVALSAPYMHNGAFSTLEEVIQFYADGGGNAYGMEGIDPFVLGFDLTEQEKSDLVAFLVALTDESALPTAPETVPSGLPVVSPMENPARELVAQTNISSSSGQTPVRNSTVITVQQGETIQAAVDRALPGDTVQVPFGVYHERVVVDISDFTLLGIPNENGEWPVLDGQGKLAEGVVSSGNNFEVGFFRVIDYTSNGVLVEGVTGVHMHDLVAENTGIYGLYPVQSTDVIIEDSIVIGAQDAGIYAGQSENVVIRNNEVYENVLGIEAENTLNTEIHGNHAHDNAMGILVVLLPNLTSKINMQTRVYDNLIELNNHENFAIAGTAAALAPSGSGIALIGVDSAEVFNNIIRDNKTAGVGVFHLNIAYAENEINVPATPEDNFIYDNEFAHNGFDPDAFVRDLGIPGADILWDVSGAGNRFDQPGASSFPPVLPGSRWPALFYNAYWRMLNFLIGLL